MIDMTRGRAIATLGATAFALAGCAGTSAVRVGSKNFTEELFLGELYAQALEKKGMHVERKLSLGSIDVAMAALERGEIDVYPEYTGTALLVQLKLPASNDEAQIYRTVKAAYEQQYGATWLDPAPFNDTQALAVTAATAARYHLRTLSDLSAAAPALRLGAIPEFVKRPDGLAGLQRIYGGFRFKDIRQFDVGLKYKALIDGQVDVTVAFSTEGAIAQYNLLVLEDDRHAFPPYAAAPVVRLKALQAMPAIATALNPLASLLTDAKIRAINNAIDGPAKREPADVAREFLAQNGIGA